MRIEGIRLVEKRGGKSGHYRAKGVERGAAVGRRRARPRARRRRAAAGEDAPLQEADGRVLAGDLAALRTQPPADVSAMDGYAVRAADVASVPVTLKVIGEVAAGHPFDGAVGAGEAARIFTGGVRAAGRRHHRDPGEHARATATPSSSNQTCRDGQARARRRARFRRGTVLLPRGTPPERPRPGARRRDEPSGCAGPSPAQGRGAGDRRRAGAARQRAGPGEIVYSNGFALMALARGEGRRGDRPRHRARPGRCDHRGGPARARELSRHAGHHRRRLGRRLRSRAEGAGCRRAGAVVLAGGAAARAGR